MPEEFEESSLGTIYRWPVEELALLSQLFDADPFVF